MFGLAPTYKPTWKVLGIVSALKLATFDLSYTAPMLGVSLYFWCPAINNFYFSYGMMGPSLMEVSTLTGLSTDGNYVSWSIEYPENDFDINFDSFSISNFIQNNMGSDGDPITDSEHVAVLLL
ncbi:hypothetical protein Ahy_B06g085381 [Arachis hypogaea]|uniref:Aminotransferase-like plant mobile domain-containing protein n=1 Tax=Arachis hypogaea TaxID=3818 RepID=A0A444YUB2_ARAHY|nr:hypothetical protein Ahy_B06g085381 [Arachis hypogaea]